jgi:Tol biopolymer transport system component
MIGQLTLLSTCPVVYKLVEKAHGTLPSKMDPENQNEELDNLKVYTRKRNIFIAVAAASLLLVLVFGSWYALTTNPATSSPENKLVVSEKDKALSAARKIYYSKKIDEKSNTLIYSVDQNGENDIPFIEKCPGGGNSCILEPVAVSSDGEFIYFNSFETDIGSESSSGNKTYRIRKDGDSPEFLWFGRTGFFSPDFLSVLIIAQDLTLIMRKYNADGSYQDFSTNLPDGYLLNHQFSPDGKYVQVLKDKEVYNFDPVTGKIVGKKIDNLVPGRLSPDGKKVLDGDEEGGMFFADSNGKNKHYFKGKYDYLSSWSRDGSSILAVKHNEDETCDIQILELNPERTKIVNEKVVKHLDGNPLFLRPTVIW